MHLAGLYFSSGLTYSLPPAAAGLAVAQELTMHACMNSHCSLSYLKRLFGAALLPLLPLLPQRPRELDNGARRGSGLPPRGCAPAGDHPWSLGAGGEGKRRAPRRAGRHSMCAQ